MEKTLYEPNRGHRKDVMSINSREKGKRGELEIAHVLQEYGYETRRNQQYNGANGDADVVGLPGIHMEVKRVQRLNIDNALEQAIRDTYADEIKQGADLIPAVFHRSNSDHKKDSTKGTWKVTLRLDDFMKLYQAWDIYNLPFSDKEE